MSRSLSLSTWIVDVSTWKPNALEWETTLNLFPVEIQDKLNSYHHQMDAKRSLVGKLLAQSFACSSYSIPWNQIKFATNPFGKPYLANKLPPGKQFNFNITHDGDMVGCIFTQESWSQPEIGKTEGVTEAEEIGKTHEVGIDIMQIKLPTGQDDQEFLEFMEEHLSDEEKRMIDRIKVSEESHSFLLVYLLQIWTLKESVIKALGCGLHLELDSISLSALLPQSDLDIGQFTLSSTDSDDERPSNQCARSRTLPTRSDLIISLGNKQDPEWKFWNATWTSNQSSYIFAAAIKVNCPRLFAINQLVLKLEMKSVSDLVKPQ